MVAALLHIGQHARHVGRHWRGHGTKSVASAWSGDAAPNRHEAPRAYGEGALYRGLVPGLVRSSIANGTSMMVYKRVHAALSHAAGREGRSNI